MKIFLLRLLFTTVLMSFSAMLLAQPAIEWDKSFTGSADDRVIKAINTSDGGHLLGGYSNTQKDGDKSASGKGGYDFWLIKIAADGTKLWNKTYGGALDEKLNELRQTSDGGYILAGYSISNIGGDKSENSRGSSDYWIVKIDQNGNKEWDKTFGGSSWESLIAARHTSDGGYILAGNSGSDASGDKSQDKIDKEETSSDMWLVKISSLGKLEWEKTVGNQYAGELSCFDLAADGGYIAGFDLGGFEQASGLYYAVKYNTAAEVQWGYRYGNPETYNQLRTISQTLDGGYMLGGYMYSTDGGSPVEYLQSNDSYLVKIDAAGKLEWEKTYGSVDVFDEAPSMETVTSVVQTADGGYLVGGASSGLKGADKSENSRGGQDFWVFKLQADGNMLWDKTIGGSGQDLLLSMVQTEDSGFLLAGISKSPASGEKTESPQQTQTGYDVWIVKLNAEKPVLASVITSFTASKEGTGVALNWNTASENTIDRFEVEKSLDRLTWKSIGEVKTSPEAKSYSYVDASTEIGIEMLYRLKMVKPDKKVIYSKERSVVFAAETPEIVWDKVFGGPNIYNYTSMIKTADGGYLIGGMSNEAIGGDKTQPGKGDEDYWIIKITADGIKQWDKTFGGSGDDRLTSIIQTSDGGYLLGGTSISQKGGDKSEDNKSVTSYKWEDFWLVKIDVQGKKQWDRTLGDEGTESFPIVVEAQDGGYIVAGNTNSSGRVIKVDANGKQVWEKHTGSFTLPFSFTATSDGNFLIGESYDNSYDITKFSQDFTRQWTKFVKVHQTTIVSLVQTRDEGYILGGYSQDNYGVVTRKDDRGQSDMKVLKIDKDGALQWEKTIGSNRRDRISSIIQTLDGGYLLAGNSDSDMEWDKTDGTRGYPDYWLVKLQEDGTKMWDKTMGGDGIDELSSIFQMPDGGYLIGGRSSRATFKGEKTAESKGAVDYWVLKLAPKDPLPVTLTSFTAQKENKTALLSWQTATETHSERFEVQHSLDGKSWKLLGTITAKGESSSSNNYEYVHNNPAMDKDNLYRLKMIDTDQTFTYSKLASLHFDLDIVLNVFPNPSPDVLTLQVGNWLKVREVKMLNSQGKTMYFSDKSPSRHIAVTKLSSGLYFVKITMDDGSSYLKRVLINR